MDKEKFDQAVAEIWSLYEATSALTKNKLLPRAVVEKVQHDLQAKAVGLANQLNAALEEEVRFVTVIG